MAASLYAKVLSEQEVTTIITKQQEEKKKLDVELLNPDNYLYKGSPLNLGISLDMDDIKKHPENTFFDVDNNNIISENNDINYNITFDNREIIKNNCIHNFKLIKTNFIYDIYKPIIIQINDKNGNDI